MAEPDNYCCLRRVRQDQTSCLSPGAGVFLMAAAVLTRHVTTIPDTRTGPGFRWIASDGRYEGDSGGPGGSTDRTAKRFFAQHGMLKRPPVASIELLFYHAPMVGPQRSAACRSQAPPGAPMADGMPPRRKPDSSPVQAGRRRACGPAGDRPGMTSGSIGTGLASAASIDRCLATVTSGAKVHGRAKSNDI